MNKDLILAFCFGFMYCIIIISTICLWVDVTIKWKTKSEEPAIYNVFINSYGVYCHSCADEEIYTQWGLTLHKRNLTKTEAVKYCQEKNSLVNEWVK